MDSPLCSATKISTYLQCRHQVCRLQQGQLANLVYNCRDLGVRIARCPSPLYPLLCGSNGRSYVCGRSCCTNATPHGARCWGGHWCCEVDRNVTGDFRRPGRCRCRACFPEILRSGRLPIGPGGLAGPAKKSERTSRRYMYATKTLLSGFITRRNYGKGAPVDIQDRRNPIRIITSPG